MGTVNYVRNGRGLEALRTSVGRFWDLCVPYKDGGSEKGSPKTGIQVVLQLGRASA